MNHETLHGAEPRDAPAIAVGLPPVAQHHAGGWRIGHLHGLGPSVARAVAEHGQALDGERSAGCVSQVKLAAEGVERVLRLVAPLAVGGHGLGQARARQRLDQPLLGCTDLLLLVQVFEEAVSVFDGQHDQETAEAAVRQRRETITPANWGCDRTSALAETHRAPRPGVYIIRSESRDQRGRSKPQADAPALMCRMDSSRRARVAASRRLP